MSDRRSTSLVTVATLAAFASSIGLACGAGDASERAAPSTGGRTTTAAPVSVDGTIVTWTSDRNRRLVQVRTRDLATGTSRTLDVAQASGAATNITLGPDATRVAWLEVSAEHAVVAIGDLRTGAVRRLTLPAVRQPQATGPAWSADGRELALALTATAPYLGCGTDRASDGHLYIVSSDLSSLREVEPLPATALEAGVSSVLAVQDWSPVGDQLLYELVQWGETGECRGMWAADLYVFDVGTQSSTRLASGHTWWTAAVWSPHGTQVAYAGGPCDSGDDRCTHLFDRRGVAVGALRDPWNVGVWWTRAGIFSLVETSDAGGFALLEFDGPFSAGRRPFELGSWVPEAVSDAGVVAVTSVDDDRLRVLSPTGEVLLVVPFEGDGYVVLR